MTDSDSGSKSSKSTSSDSDSPKLVKKANSSKRRPLIIEKNAKKAKKNPASEKPKKAFIRRLEAPVISSSGSEETGSGTDSDSSLSKPNLVDSHSKSAKKSTPKATPMPDDETVILKRAIGFKAEKNDIGEFYEFVKISLHINVTRAQLTDKIQRLKKKYLRSKKNNSKKNDHIDGMDNDRQKSKIEVEKKNNDCLFIQYSALNDSKMFTEEIVKAGLELTDDSKRAELEEKRKALDEQELMLYMKRLEFLKNQALVALEGIRKLSIMLESQPTHRLESPGTATGFSVIGYVSSTQPRT
ncbi:hypothetical protein E3N88_06470 [Mikania micrantha]|uniref:Glabrous enhancer-binding protein-like DBD domain-containing protein n=1 Tax=Mikania micrantha TaxID=192012 RepID=A0A5N6PNS5_9ASTR|nr:hypothetical protein E3N88_06470 [Mikania micrantha]